MRNVARSRCACQRFCTPRHLIFQGFLLTERLGIRFCDRQGALMLVATPQKKIEALSLICRAQGSPHLRDKRGEKTLAGGNLPQVTQQDCEYNPSPSVPLISRKVPIQASPKHRFLPGPAPWAGCHQAGHHPVLIVHPQAPPAWRCLGSTCVLVVVHADVNLVGNPANISFFPL